MEVQTMSHRPNQSVAELLQQVDVDGAPLRIDSKTNTYYVLSADQLLALLKNNHGDEKSPQFTPADFGLSEADITNYQALHRSRSSAIAQNKQAPLSANLRKRLRQSEKNNFRRPESEQLLHELEDEMLRNLESVVG